MEAKETVMSDKKIRTVVGDSWCAFPMSVFNQLTSIQAEISFKAGYKYALEGAVIEGGYESVKKAGIRKVVEWIEGNSWDGSLQHWGAGDNIGIQCFHLDEWQAKLKDWGIDA